MDIHIVTQLLFRMVINKLQMLNEKRFLYDRLTTIKWSLLIGQFTKLTTISTNESDIS